MSRSSVIGAGCATLLGVLLSGCPSKSADAALVPVDPTLGAPPCVDFQSLRGFLPAELSGFHRTKDEGSTGKYGEVSVSEAQRVFVQKDGREVSVRIVDTTLAKKLGKAIVDAVGEEEGRAEADPAAPIHWGETVGFVRYDRDENKAEANLWVGGRYVVAISTSGFDGTAEARRVAKELDLDGLAQLH